MYICIYTYTYAYIYIYIHTHVHGRLGKSWKETNQTAAPQRFGPHVRGENLCGIAVVIFSYVKPRKHPKNYEQPIKT